MSDMNLSSVTPNNRKGNSKRKAQQKAKAVSTEMSQMKQQIEELQQRLKIVERQVRGFGGTSAQLELPGFDKENTPLSANNDVSLNSVADQVSVESPDLVTLYRTKFPKSQMETILVVMYHRITTREDQFLTYDDIQEGFMELLPAGVSVPVNPRQGIAQGVKAKLIYRHQLQDGKFALTFDGKAFVENMG